MIRLTTFVRGPRTIRRLSVIAQKFMAQGLGFFVDRYVHLGYLPARFKFRRVAAERPEYETVPQRLVTVLQELGPTFVKLGQMLATRPDILPESYIAEFRRIYYKVQPFDPDVAKTIIEEQLDRPIDQVFASFTDAPRASGSIAQVHDAVLHDGTPVVVKVRRPNIESVIADDLHILEILADGANKIEELVPLRLPVIVAEFARAIQRELDFIDEASTISKFEAAFAGSSEIVVPKVYWDLSTSQVLTLRRIEGPNLAQMAERGYEGLDRRAVADRLAHAFLKQYFEVGMFHADPHPGNIICLPGGRLGLIDFGMVGTLTGDLRSRIGTILVAVARNQIDLAAEVFADIGVLSQEARQAQFSADVSELLRKYYGIPLKSIDTGRVFQDLMRVAREHNVLVPRDFVLLGKSVVMMAGLARELDESLNVAELARPYAKHLIREKVSARSLERKLTEELYYLGNLLWHGPKELRGFFRKIMGGQFEVRVMHEGLTRHVAELDRTGNRLALSVMLAAIIIGSSQILSSRIGPSVGAGAWKMSALGLFGYLISLALGLWLIFGIFRSGRL